MPSARRKSSDKPSMPKSASPERAVAEGVEKLIGSIGGKFGELSDARLRRMLTRTVRKILPISNGRPTDPKTARAIELHSAKVPWKDIFPDPKVLGPRPTDPDKKYLWDSAATRIRKNVKRGIYRRKKRQNKTS